MEIRTPIADSTLSTCLRRAQDRARATDSSVLLSVRAPVSSTDLLEVFNAAPDADRFLFEQPAANAAFLGLGHASLLEASGPTRFESVRSLADELFSNAIDCGSEAPSWVAPRFAGGFAFDAEPAASATWNGFSPARLVLPEIQILERATETWLVLNQIVDAETSLEKALLRFWERCEWLESLEPSAAPSACPVGPVEHKRVPPIPKEETAESEIIREPGPTVRAHYIKIVNDALNAIAKGTFEKVVVARSTALFCREPLDPGRMLENLRTTFPSCTLFAIASGRQTFLGASPERLASLEDGKLRIDALAGSAARGATPEEDEARRRRLESSTKERAEHAIVVRDIRDAVAELCEEIQVPEKPTVLRLDAIQHLHSPILARVDASRSILDFIEKLHPTAAIAGAPRDCAQDWLKKNEDLERGWYTGPIGWFDARGSGDFSVALRCALLKPHEILFFAGAGIVSESDPEQELDETRLKLRASLLAFLEIGT